MTRVIGSARVSTEEQGRGDSLEHQDATIRAYCAAHHLELVRIEVDAGASASTLEREGLERALAAIGRGEASGIVVTKLDRLTRSVLDLENLKLQGMGAEDGWRLFSVAEQIDTASVIGNAFLQILTVLAELERKNTAKRTKDLLAYARSQGQPLGGVPYGWKLVKVARDANGRRVGERGRLERDEGQQKELRVMQAYRRNGLSLSEIAERMNAAGVPSPRGSRWTKMGVWRALKTQMPGDDPASSQAAISSDSAASTSCMSSRGS